MTIVTRVNPHSGPATVDRRLQHEGGLTTKRERLGYAPHGIELRLAQGGRDSR